MEHQSINGLAILDFQIEIQLDCIVQDICKGFIGFTFCRITLILARFRTEHIDTKESLHSKLHFHTICSVRILATNRVISEIV